MLIFFDIHVEQHDEYAGSSVSCHILSCCRHLCRACATVSIPQTCSAVPIIISLLPYFSKVRLAIELLLLAKALVFFFTLVYVHTAFIKNPCTCLQEVQNWPREGVIRVEIIPHLAEKRAIWQSIRQDKQVVQTLKRT